VIVTGYNWDGPYRLHAGKSLARHSPPGFESELPPQLRLHAPWWTGTRTRHFKELSIRQERSSADAAVKLGRLLAGSASSRPRPHRLAYFQVDRESGCGFFRPPLARASNSRGSGLQRPNHRRIEAGPRFARNAEPWLHPTEGAPVLRSDAKASRQSTTARMRVRD